MKLLTRAREDAAHIRTPDASARLSRVTASLEIRSINPETGEFSGWASVFNELDTYDSRMIPGCFRRSLAALKAANRAPAVLWQHNVREPIARALLIEERDKGLWLDARLELQIPRAREALALLKPDPLPAINGLSVGFVPIEWRWTDGGDILEFTDVDLWEASIVTFPACDGARIETVRGVAEINTQRDLERLLRDAGYSRNDARELASKFQPKASPRDAGAAQQPQSEPADAHLRAILAALQS